MEKNQFHHLLRILFSVFLILLTSSAYSKTPLPEIKVNNAGGHVRFIPGEETLNVSLQLDTAGKTNHADWFLAVNTPYGFFFGTLNGWSQQVTPVTQTPLFSFPRTNLLSFTASALPSGQYTLYFAVDMQMDGVITWDQLYANAVDITILDKNLPKHSKLIKASSGGTLNVTNNQGDRITLVIPPNSLQEDTVITMTALNAVASNPINKNLLPGVVLSPQGTVLQEPARLTVRLASSADSPETSALFLVKSPQLALPLSERLSSTKELEANIYHFSTVNAAEITSGQEIDQIVDAIRTEVRDKEWQEVRDEFKGLLEMASFYDYASNDSEKKAEILEEAEDLVKKAMEKLEDDDWPEAKDKIDGLFEFADMASEVGLDELAEKAVKDARSAVASDCADFLSQPKPQDLCGAYKESFVTQFELFGLLVLESCFNGKNRYSWDYFNEQFLHLKIECDLKEETENVEEEENTIAGLWQITEHVDESKCVVAGSGEPGFYTEVYTSAITLDGEKVSFKGGSGTLDGNTISYTSSFAEDGGRVKEWGSATFGANSFSGSSDWTFSITWDDGSDFNCSGTTTFSGVKL